MKPELKRVVSTAKVQNVTVGFLWWLQLDNKMHGLKDKDIMEFAEKLYEVHQEYKSKYPQGLVYFGITDGYGNQLPINPEEYYEFYDDEESDLCEEK